MPLTTVNGIISELLLLEVTMLSIKRLSIYIPTLLLLYLFLSCNSKKEVATTEITPSYQGKKVLYLDSYHKEYSSNVLARESYISRVKNSGIITKFEYLDAKRIKDSSALHARAMELKTVVEEWKPDIIVAADDAINQYLIAPHYSNSAIPVVFIGVNWSATTYGFPTQTVTGQLEVELVEKLLTDLKKYGKGERVGLLTGNTLTDRKTIKHYKEILNISFEKEVLVDDFTEWKKQYKAMQDSVDVLLLRANSGIEGWDKDEAISFVKTHSRIPSGSINISLHDYVLLSYPKLNSEFGEYAAETTLKILGGKSPNEIPISKNKKTKITINTSIAEKLAIKFPIELMEISHLVGNNKKILFINSYHQGYDWSDDIEYGFIRALGIKAHPPFKNQYDTDQLDVKIFRMDTKNNQAFSHMKQKANEVKTLIEKWEPDVVVASDDNASKYLIAPHFKNSTLPFIFCGLNWDASVYGFPTKNVTGMVEVAPVLKLIAFLKTYAKGAKIGYIGSNVVSERKELQHYKKVLDITFADGTLISTFDEWKKEYLRLQKSVDILIMLNQVGIPDWDETAAKSFVKEHTVIPSGTSTKNIRGISLVAFSRIAEEQGMWAGERALEVIAGKKVIDIPVVTNQNSTVHLNMALAKKLNIIFPTELIERSTLIEEETYIK